MTKKIHTTFYSGSKIRVIFKSGDMLICKFLQKQSQKFLQVQLADGATSQLSVADIRAIGYYKPHSHERTA